MTTTATPPAAPARPPRAEPTRHPAGGPRPSDPDPAERPVLAVPTLIGALAVLAATAAIPPMISGDGWWWPTVEVIAVIWLVGVGARLARVPTVLVMVLQVAAVCIALTALFTTGGIGGVLPNGTVLGEAGDLLSGAWEQIRQSVPPAPATVELSFLTAATVGVTALIVDILIAVCRAPALVALPLLCVYSVPASINLNMLPWFAFAGPALLYALLLVTTGLQGRRIRAGAGAARVAAGIAIAAVTIVVALLAASAMTTVGTAGRLPRSGITGESTGVGLSPFASLKGNLTRGEPVEMMRVSGLPAPDYLRTIGLQKWTPGEGWSVDTLSSGQLPSTAPPPDAVTVTVASSAYRDRFLPIYSGTNQIAGLDAGWSFDAALESVHRDEAVTPGPYQITVSESRPTADELRVDTVTPGGILTETGELAPEVTALAEQVTASQQTAFDKAQALTNYFTDSVNGISVNGFAYSLDVPVGDSGDPLVDFLRLKQGFCEQYASAMAIMLRAVGIPARVAVGFTQGEQGPDGSYVITSNDAHAWVEVLFNSAGWVRFDPTPLGAGQGGQQGFAAPTGTATSAPATTGGSAQTGGLASDDVPTGDNSDDIPTIDAAGSSTTAAPSGPDIGPTVWFVFLALAVLGALGALPSIVRTARRRHRLAAGDAGGPGAAAAVWREIEDLAVDHGLGLNAAESARATANRLAKAAHLDGAGRDDLRAVVMAAEREWYSAGAAGVRESDLRIDAGTAAGDGPIGAPASGGNGEAPPRRAATVGILEHPAGRRLSAAARTLEEALDRAAPLAVIDRLVPRSVRPSWWRR